jgi:hypothetical protein
MDFIEKCHAAGIGDGSSYEGYPIIDNRVIRKVNGSLKAFMKEALNPWETPREDREFDSATLTKIQAIEDGKLDQLTQAEQDAISAAELAEIEKASAPSLTDLDKRLEAIEVALAK